MQIVQNKAIIFYKSVKIVPLRAFNRDVKNYT
ncbi:hypothetical protein Pedsa_0558 [Pseudopedobacter saltans DSM 12145]|uniref:Uncharacterized protein n=1 Tax=Pseudopedobacter saltans (strain ATCC 51119 / DSM 12145 / JCM 21818 / CCUG 39354 / LMG 10337 / NBRC 100064 / NCIMB 13643) TaxID=762903 RepID=F0S7B2_PSESL|nr:hypothetical protein Pedsa_0558 [Pseudopedobacter saltans DSM 12145]